MMPMTMVVDKKPGRLLGVKVGEISEKKLFFHLFWRFRQLLTPNKRHFFLSTTIVMGIIGKVILSANCSEKMYQFFAL